MPAKNDESRTMNKLTRILLAVLLLLWLPGEISAQAPCGDCLEDGTINILDALRAAQEAVGLAVPVGPCCDVAVPPALPNGVIDIIDALTVAQFVAGVVPNLQCACPPYGFAVLTGGELLTYHLDSAAPAVLDSVSVAGPAPHLLAAQRDLDRCFTVRQGAAANVEVWNVDVATGTFLGGPQNVPLPAATVARGLIQDEVGGFFYLVDRADPAGCLSMVSCTTTPTPACLGQLLYFEDFGSGPQLQWTAPSATPAQYGGMSYPASRPGSTEIWVTDLDVAPPIPVPGCSTFPGLHYFDNMTPIAAGALAPINPAFGLHLFDVEWDAAGEGLLVAGELDIGGGTTVPLLAMPNTVAGPSFGAALMVGGGPFPFPVPVLSSVRRLTVDGANQRGWFLNGTSLVEFTYLPPTAPGVPGMLFGVLPTIDLGVMAADIAFNERTQTLTLGGFPTANQITVIDIPPGGIGTLGGVLPPATPLTVPSAVERVVTY